MNRLFRWSLLIAPIFWISCAGSKTQLEADLMQIVDLENRKMELEQKYVWNLSHLEVYPTDRKLRLKQLEIKKEIDLIKSEIKIRRKNYDLGIREWEKRIVDGRVEKKFSDKVKRKNRRKIDNY